MRSVQSGLYKVFCQGHAAKCEINSSNRQSCKKCRFEKCLEVGMKIAYVKSLEERCQKVMLSQKIEKPKLSEYFDENFALADYNDKKIKVEVEFMFHFYSDKPGLFIEHFCTVMPGNPSDQMLEEWSKIDRLFLVQSMQTCAKMDNVSAQDANVLLNHNYDKFHTLSYMLVFKNQAPWHDQFFKFIHLIGNNKRPVNAEINLLMELLDQFGDATNRPKVTYDQVFVSPWAAHVEIEDEHEKIFNKVMTWLDQIDNYEHYLMLLLQLILLYNCDGIESQLQDLPKVQKLQAYYGKLLHKYLKSKVEEKLANTLFSKGIMFVHDTQRAFELSMQRLKLE